MVERTERETGFELLEGSAFSPSAWEIGRRGPNNSGMALSFMREFRRPFLHARISTDMTIKVRSSHFQPVSGGRAPAELTDVFPP